MSEIKLTKAQHEASPQDHHTLRGLWLNKRNSVKHVKVSLRTGRATEAALDSLIKGGYLAVFAGAYFFTESGLAYCKKHFTTTEQP